jgi:glycosyltransferase involved in cell wall biosynthesis
MITFIIPTIGRKTLINSIESIINQTNTDWKIIVIFDGIKSNININNPKITILEIDKKDYY